MTSALQIGHSTLTAEGTIPLLVGYQMIPQLICENIIDRAIVSIYCTPQEVAQAYQEFYQRWGLISEDQKQAWRSHYGLSQEQLEQLATRKLRVEKFKQVTWGHKIESYFLKRSRQLDQVIYSFIQNRDRGIANELYFRLREGEQSFAELASKYSQGPEAYTGGVVGPVELGTLLPNLAELLCTSQIGEVQPPVRFGELQVIVRLEKWIPARLDDKMRQRLLKEKFEAWFQEQLHQLSHHDQIWMGITPNHQADAIGSITAA